MQTELLFIFRHSPYGSSSGREGLEAALAGGAFEQNMAILFLDDGVWQLTDNQQADLISKKNHQKMASALPLFGIDQLYYAQSSLEERNIQSDHLAIAAEAITDQQVGTLLQNSKNILSF